MIIKNITFTLDAVARKIAIYTKNFLFTKKANINKVPEKINIRSLINVGSERKYLTMS